MSRQTREATLAAELERAAAGLRNGDATLYGYDVDLDPFVERGGVSYAGGWLTFEREREG